MKKNDPAGKKFQLNGLGHELSLRNKLAPILLGKEKNNGSNQ